MEIFDQGTIWLLLTQFLFRAPMITIFIIGIILSLIYFRSFPKTAVRSGIGLIISLSASILGIPVSMLPMLMRNSLGYAEIGVYMSIISTVLSLLSVVGFALILWAVWTKEASRH